MTLDSTGEILKIFSKANAQFTHLLYPLRDRIIRKYQSQGKKESNSNSGTSALDATVGNGETIFLRYFDLAEILHRLDQTSKDRRSIASSLSSFIERKKDQHSQNDNIVAITPLPTYLPLIDLQLYKPRGD